MAIEAVHAGDFGREDLGHIERVTKTASGIALEDLFGRRRHIPAECGNARLETAIGQHHGGGAHLGKALRALHFEPDAVSQWRGEEAFRPMAASDLASALYELSFQYA